jgi:hypothetical protein
MAAKAKPVAPTPDTRPLGGEKSWARTNGTYLKGRAYIDGADKTAAEMEAKWGADRLRLLVSPELREKFDRQRYLFNQAIWFGELEDVRRESGRMVNAWMALDGAAESAGALKLSREVWEVTLADGSVAATRQCRRASSRSLHARGNRSATVAPSAHRKNQESLSRGDSDRGWAIR